MKALWVANDFGNISNPIGRYAKVLTDEMCRLDDDFEVTVVSASTDGFNKLQRCLSLRMTKALFQAARCVLNDKIQVVEVEYPFIEWSPCILPAYKALKWAARKRNCALVLSLHEYLRTKPGRQMVVRSLIRSSDALLVSDEETKRVLSELCENCYVRTVFSSIAPSWLPGETKEISREFVYFGVVNSSKAFQEMLDAFSVFNRDKKKTLSIYTSTDLHGMSLPEGVILYSGCPDQVVADALKRAAYCILPIRPEIGAFSSTFMGAAQAGCICIGHFPPAYLSNKFVVDVADYSRDRFAEGLNIAYKMSDDCLKENFVLACTYGTRFSIGETAKTTLCTLKSVIEGSKKEYNDES